MTSDPLGKAGPHPDLLAEFADGLSRIVVKGKPLQVEQRQLEVLQQRTLVGRPQVGAPEKRTASISSCFVLLHDVPPDNTKGLGICFAFQEDPSSPWRVTMHQARSMPYPPPKPFEMMQIIDPLIGIAFGVQVYNPGIAALRAELADGTVLEDRVSNQSLCLMLPVYAPDGWADEEAPVVRLLEESGRDLIPPFPIRLQKRPPSPPSATEAY